MYIQAWGVTGVEVQCVAFGTSAPCVLTTTSASNASQPERTAITWCVTSIHLITPNSSSITSRSSIFHHQCIPDILPSWGTRSGHRTGRHYPPTLTLQDQRLSTRTMVRNLLKRLAVLGWKLDPPQASSIHSVVHLLIRSFIYSFIHSEHLYSADVFKIPTKRRRQYSY